MATTRIISMHVSHGKTIADCLTDRIDYSKNPEKTQGGELISAYECDPKTADAEFLFADDPGAALLQELVVGQQAAGDGVFDGRDAQQRRIGGHPGEQLVETQAGQHLYFPVCEIAARRRFVIASCDALYCDLFHNGLKKKIPLNRAGFSCHINLYYLYTVNCMRSRFFPCYKRKSNKNSMQNRMLSSFDGFYRWQM